MPTQPPTLTYFPIGGPVQVNGVTVADRESLTIENRPGRVPRVEYDDAQVDLLISTTRIGFFAKVLFARLRRAP